MRSFLTLLFLALILFIPACANSPVPVTNCDIPQSYLADTLSDYPEIKTNGDLLTAYNASLFDLNSCNLDKKSIREYVNGEDKK
jgi:hypothetical protein